MSYNYYEMIKRQSEIIDNSNQEVLEKATVCVIGCGGLGGVVIDQLVRVGIGNLILVDEDIFDVSNFNRQLLSGLSTLSKSKVEVAKDHVLNINPNINVDISNDHVDMENIDNIVSGSDIVVDAVDNVLTRVIVSRKCHELDIPFVHGAVESSKGQVSVFMGDSPSYEELFQMKSFGKSIEGDVLDYINNLSSYKPQVLGVCPCITGCLEVIEVIKVLCGFNDVILAPNILMFDVLDFNSFKIISL